MPSQLAQHDKSKASPPLTLRVACEYDAVRRAAAQARVFLTAQSLSETELWACELAFVEACNNAVRHTPPTSYREGIAVEIRRTGNQVQIRINDHSQDFELPTEIDLPAPDQEQGRGLYLMKSLMDQMQYVRIDSGHCLILTKQLGAHNEIPV